MKKKVIIITIISVIVVAAIAVAVVFLLTNNKITISFDTDGAESVSSITINKGESIKLPEIEKDGYILDGWFLEAQRITEDTTFKESVTLKAKWISSKAKTFTVSFDSKGGSNVKNVIVECGKTLTLPTDPTKEGYLFDGWEDKNGTPILNGALFTCNNVKLYAKWVELEANQTESGTKCPDGFELNSANVCFSKVKVTESCPSGYLHSSKQGICYSEQIVPYESVCKKETINGKQYDGELLHERGSTYYCGYLEVTRFYDDKRSCEHSGYIYTSINKKCYTKYILNNYETVCPSGTYEAKPGVLEDSQTVKKCVYTKATTRTCPTGYVQEGNYCYKFVNPQ